MTREQRKFVLSRICGESIHLVTEKIDPRATSRRRALDVIFTGRDRSLSRRQQRRSIAALPGFGTVIPMDACHDSDGQVSRNGWQRYSSAGAALLPMIGCGLVQATRPTRGRGGNRR